MLSGIFVAYLAITSNPSSESSSTNIWSSCCRLMVVSTSVVIPQVASVAEALKIRAELNRRPHPSKMAETPEFKIVRRSLVAVRACISVADIVNFAGELFQDGLISDAGHQAAIAVTGTAPSTVVARLVSEAMNKLSNSSENFYRFVSIIESRDTNLASILKNDYDLHHTRTVRRGTPRGTRFDHQAERALGRPGKPHVTNVTHNSLVLSWEKPQYGADSVQSYTITYRAKNDPSNSWIVLAATQLEHAKLTDLVAETVYYFKVRVESTSGISGPYSESSDPIKTRRVPLTERMLLYCKHISSPDGLKIYLLPTLVTTRKSGYQKVTVAHPQHLAVAAHKVLLLVGATGAGKSTLINAMANYIMGVDWEDEYRFKLISEETAHDQTKSQTKCITAYTFHKQKGSPLPYTLTVIDTPGFGNTRERDDEIFQQIKELLTAQGDEGIDRLHGIGFITQAPQTRLTPTQQYVFDSILSVFGKDVADNIFLMVTFADRRQPPVLDAARAAGVLFKSHFEFNNSAVFVKNDEYSQLHWRMNRTGLQDFMVRLSNARTKQTGEVLRERGKLKTAVEGLLSFLPLGIGITLNEIRLQKQSLSGYELERILKNHYSVINKEKEIKTTIEALKEELTQSVMEDVKQASQALRRLRQLTLKFNHLTIIIDDLIESEQRKTRPLWKEHVIILRGLCNLINTIAEQGEGALIDDSELNMPCNCLWEELSDELNKLMYSRVFPN